MPAIARSAPPAQGPRDGHLEQPASGDVPALAAEGGGMAFAKGERVEWDWGRGTARARVEEVFPRRVSRTIKGKRITRNGSPERPAYLLVQEDGGQVLKLHSELRRA